MTTYELDDVDKRLLALLQENARYTALELADRVGVSDNTIHNRMARLEEADVITGYSASVDHDRVGLDLYFLFTCTVRISDRTEVAQRALALPGVLEVTELMTGEHNLLIKAVGAKDEDITQVAEQVDDFKLEINDETLIRTEHAKPLDYIELEEVFEDGE